MRNATVRFKSLLWGILCVGAVAVSSPRALATTYTIQFGGTLGLVYSPNSLSVSVGDTVTWTGDFSFHPLSSTTIPAGASSWHNETGTVFSYVVQVPGTYSYQCDNHVSLGMVGSFVATLSDVEGGSEQVREFRLEQNYPNPFNPSTLIRYSLAARSQVSLTVFNMLGEKVADLMTGEQAAGQHEVRFNASMLSSGIYLYRLTARPVEGGGDFVATRRLLLLK